MKSSRGWDNRNEKPFGPSMLHLYNGDTLVILIRRNASLYYL